MADGDPIRAIMAAVHALDTCGIAYFIGGSVASGIYGLYRATADVDIVARIAQEDVERLSSSLDERFYADVEMMREAITTRSSFNILDVQTGYKIDVFIDAGDRYASSQFERRARTKVSSAGDAVYVASAEDMILAKLRWFDAGNRVSERHWSDVIGMLRVQGGNLDYAYLQRWARSLGIAALLTAAQ